MSTDARAPILLFDVMDTLVHEPYWDIAPAFFGVTLAELQSLQDPRAWIDFELGEIDEATMCARFFRDGRAFDHAAFVESMVAGYRWIEGMEALVAELAGAGYTIHALSNYPDWYRHIEARLGLARFLRWSFVSCDHGVRKPDRRLFEIAAEALAVEPSHCLFVDDREGNCEAARATGMEAEHFAGAASLRARLVERGLLRAT